MKANLKFLLAILFFFILTINTSGVEKCEGFFADVSRSAPYCYEVEFLVKQDVLKYSQYFDPNVFITRGQFAKVIFNAFQFEENTSSNSFDDIDENSTFYNEILSLKNNGIINGTSQGTYQPDTAITRGEATKILVNAVNYQKENEINTDTIIRNIFPDLDSKNTFYGYILGIYNYGIQNNYKIINGYSDNTFRTNSFITRSQAAKVIARLMKLTGIQLIDCIEEFCSDKKLNGFPVFDFELTEYLKELVGNSRIEYSLTDFVYSSELDLIAQEWNNTMSELKFLSHNEDLSSDLTDKRISFKYNGENVATRTISDTYNEKAYFEAIQTLHKSIMSVPPPNDFHKQNILSQTHEYDQIGINVKITKDHENPNKNRIWFVQVFIDKN